MHARQWGIAWIALTVSLALHVWDEAAHDFLAVYNPTVQALRSRWPWLPLPIFSFDVWLAGLCALVVVLLLVSPSVFRGRRALRFLAYPYSVIMLFNGLQHIAGSIYFGKAMPGVISSPLLVLASLFLFVTTQRVAIRDAATN